MQDLAGRVAVVTGAASGVALATRFAAEGMQLVLADVDAAGLDAAASVVSALGCRRPRGSDRRLGWRVGRRGRGARGARVRPVRHGPRRLQQRGSGWRVGRARLGEAARRVGLGPRGQNLYGVIHGVRAFLPRLVEQGEGHLVNTASVAGLVPMLDLVRALVDAGIPAGTVAEAVVDAVRADRFWILTHRDLDDYLRDRAARIVEGRNPTSPLG